MMRLPQAAAALGAAVAMGVGCGDEPQAPDVTPTTPHLAVSAPDQEQMHLALLFARDRAALALEPRASSGVATAFGAVARRVERNDRSAVEREIAAARLAIGRYRSQAGGNRAVSPELEALLLTLDRVAALATTSTSPEDPRP